VAAPKKFPAAKALPITRITAALSAPIVKVPLLCALGVSLSPLR
jgi:hypothetical protein